MLKALNAQSIASRLFISAAFWSSTILIVAGLGLSALNARSSEASFDAQLGVDVIQTARGLGYIVEADAESGGAAGKRGSAR